MVPVLLAEHLDIVLVVYPSRLDWLLAAIHLKAYGENWVICPEVFFELFSRVTSVWQIGWVCDAKAELDLRPPKPDEDLNHSTLLTHLAVPFFA